jgi:hypothetical protein
MGKGKQKSYGIALSYPPSPLSRVERGNRNCPLSVSVVEKGEQELFPERFSGGKGELEPFFDPCRDGKREPESFL